MESVTLPRVSPRFYKIQIKKTFSKNYDKEVLGFIHCKSYLLKQKQSQ